jgi:hypothetical protein
LNQINQQIIQLGFPSIANGPEFAFYFFDVPNKDSNKGVVDTKYKWYAPLCTKMKELNTNIYTIINFLDQSDVSFPR